MGLMLYLVAKTLKDIQLSIFLHACMYDKFKFQLLLVQAGCLKEGDYNRKTDFQFRPFEAIVILGQLVIEYQ